MGVNTERSTNNKASTQVYADFEVITELGAGNAAVNAMLNNKSPFMKLNPGSTAQPPAKKARLVESEPEQSTAGPTSLAAPVAFHKSPQTAIQADGAPCGRKEASTDELDAPLALGFHRS